MPPEEQTSSQPKGKVVEFKCDGCGLVPQMNPIEWLDQSVNANHAKGLEREAGWASILIGAVGEDRFERLYCGPCWSKIGPDVRRFLATFDDCTCEGEELTEEPESEDALAAIRKRKDREA